MVLRQLAHMHTAEVQSLFVSRGVILPHSVSSVVTGPV